MAFLQLHLHSDALGMASEVNVILPEASETQIGMEGHRSDTYKTLYLLHGLSDDQSIWMRRTSIERYAARYGIAVVMPNAHRSWYCDMAHGGNYFTYVSEELPRLCRSYFSGMSAAREMNFIGGLSMGAYGALKIALRRPKDFSGVIALSGAFDVAASKNRYAGGSYWEDIFGPCEKIPGSENDVFSLTEHALVNKSMPDKLYIACGTSDSHLPASQKLEKILNTANYPHIYREIPGEHNWDLWDREIELALPYLFAENA